jgi:hypothetical protein
MISRVGDQAQSLGLRELRRAPGSGVLLPARPSETEIDELTAGDPKRFRYPDDALQKV